LQPSEEPHLPERPSSSPLSSTCHTELEEQWRTYWVDNKYYYIKEKKERKKGGRGGWGA